MVIKHMIDHPFGHLEVLSGIAALGYGALNPALAYMSYVAYSIPHESKGQAISLATWNCTNAAIFGCRAIAGRLLAAVIATWKHACNAALKADALHWDSLP